MKSKKFIIKNYESKSKTTNDLIIKISELNKESEMNCQCVSAL